MCDTRTGVVLLRFFEIYKAGEVLMIDVWGAGRPIACEGVLDMGLEDRVAVS